MESTCWICEGPLEQDASAYLNEYDGIVWVSQETVDWTICKKCKDRMVVAHYSRLKLEDDLGLDPHRTTLTKDDIDIILGPE